MNSPEKKQRAHSPEVRARYATGERYSAEATRATRQKNYEKWLLKAKKVHENRFDYSLTRQGYRTQKDPAVTVTCIRHGINFRVLPEKHIQNQHGGCNQCSSEARALTRLNSERTKFENWFNENHNEKLSIVSEFAGMTSKLDIQCSVHLTTKTLIPSTFMNQNGYGCDACAAEATGFASRLTIDKAQAQLGGSLPKGITLLDIKFDNEQKQSLILVNCAKHQTSSWERMAHVKRSPHVCRACSEGALGFASNRLRTLVELDEPGESASVGVMEIEAFGIRALKVGVTTRTLEERYAHHLKITHYEVRLFERDAYVLENHIKIKFRDCKDERIIKAGMRGGARWSGDTELFSFKQRKPIINYIKLFLEKIEAHQPDYEYELGRMVIPTPFPTSHNRKKSKLNKPVPIVGVDPKTDKIIERFGTIAEARKNGYNNVSMVLSQDSRRQLCGGLRWFKANDFEPSKMPDMVPVELGRPVFCKQRNQHFQSTMDAERVLREMGFKVSGSHIISVLKGKRKTAGGFNWAPSKLSRAEIHAQDPNDFIDFRPPPNSNSPIPVRLTSVSRPNLVKDYDSIADAAKTMGMNAKKISIAAENGCPTNGYWVSKITNSKDKK